MEEIKVVALGELLIDFTESGVSSQGNPLLEANPGGAPCNVLAMLAKLGVQTAFVGKVGKDQFGRMLKERVTNLGINTDYLYEDEKVHTTLAFVHNFEDGDREFSFYRNPGADMMLVEEEVPETLIKQAEVFHFGTLSMTHEGVRAATKKALKIAKEAGCIISFDPNLRPPLWENMEVAREQVEYGLSCCDVLKIADNELKWLMGIEDFDKAIQQIQDKYSIPLIVLSLGKDGSKAYHKNIKAYAPAFIQEHTIDTTGAGDTFGACIISHVLEHGINAYTEKELEEMLRFANAAASIVTTRKGALCVMPEKEEVMSLWR